jgi:hypothetical protein
MKQPKPVWVLLRAIDFRNRAIESSAFPVSDSPWIKDYLKNYSGLELPPVTDLLFVPLRDEPSLFEYFSVGSDWSFNVFHFAGLDPATGKCCARQWGSHQH